MSLSPAATFTLGNLRYASHAIEVAVELGLLPAVNSARLRLPAVVEVTATVGDPAALTLDGGEGGQVILTGKVRTVRRQPLATEVLLGDGGADLAHLRPAATFERQAGKNIVRALAAAANVAAGSLDLELPLAAYVAHQGQTAAEHIADLAALGGALATISAAGDLTISAWPEGQATAALRYGRELLTYTVDEEQPSPARPVAIGAGPAGSAEAPEALRLSRQPLPADAPAAGAAAIWQPAAILRTPGAATAATQAARRRQAATTRRAQAECFLLPALRPGQVIEVQSTPPGLAGGSWLLTHVRHTLVPRLGGRTIWHGLSLGAADAGLLGALRGASGGLL